MNKFIKLTAVLFAVVFSLFAFISCIKNDYGAVLPEQENSGNIIDNNPQGENNELGQNNNSGETAAETVMSEADYSSNTTKMQALVSLNVRKQPFSGAEILGVISSGSRLTYVKSSDGWHTVFYNGKVGYVSANSNYSALVDISAANAKVELVISIGYSVLGTPYQFGAQRLLLYSGKANPNFTGSTFDCSSFVQYAFYKGAGIFLYGDSRSMSVQGREIAASGMQRGDILFMTSTSRMNNTGIEKIGHVAIYLGGNKILHTFGTGGVRVQEYTDFWKGRTLFVKRMF